MLHHCGLRNEWVSEQAFVALVMQHTMEPERCFNTNWNWGILPGYQMQHEAMINDQKCDKRVLNKRQDMDVVLLWLIKCFGILELGDSTWIPVAFSIPNL